MIYAEEVKEAARKLFLRGLKPGEIAKQLGISSIRTLYNWIEKGEWRELSADSVELAISRRLNLLIEKDNKTNIELKEIDRLIDNLSKIAKIERIKSKPVGDGESEGSNKKKSGQAKNDLSHITAEDFKEKFHTLLYAYQKQLHEVKNDPTLSRTRNILKSRQIGATWYFSGEAFEDAVLTGDNQIFLSASRSQAEIFLAYIRAFCLDWFDIELKGNPIILSNGAELRFLSTNSRTAQGYHGHVYVDEYFWIPGFKKLKKLAGAMASHKKWRRTFFSIPSTLAHEGHPYWSGDEYNEKRKDKVDFPSFNELRKGKLCPDKQYRMVITLEDAISGGCDLFDLEQIKSEYTKDEYDNLYMCLFIDDSQSVFAMSELSQCVADALLWEEFNPGSARPFGNNPVWLGYDPSRTRDNATCVVLAPPLKPGGIFRVLEKFQWQGQNIQYQANRIKDLTERYNVTYIGVDITGIGYGVYDLIKDFFPRTTPIHYNIENKTQMVLKALDVISNKRLLWDAEHKDIPQAFLMIKKTVTPGGLITYSANRSALTGHADVAWAIMHALLNEPLNHSTRRKSSVTLSEAA